MFVAICYIAQNTNVSREALSDLYEQVSLKGTALMGQQNRSSYAFPESPSLRSGSRRRHFNTRILFYYFPLWFPNLKHVSLAFVSPVYFRIVNLISNFNEVVILKLNLRAGILTGMK